MPEMSVYNELAVYYEQLDRADRDGAREAGVVEDVLLERIGSGSLSVLDVGCGVGTHLRHMETDFECVGLDVNEGVVEVANERTDDATVLRGDMHALPFTDAFDCITMLFHTLAYAASVDDMHGILRECYDALDSGGILVVELAPFVPEAMPDDAGVDREVRTYTDDDVTITSVQVSRVEDRDLVLNSDYLVALTGEATATHHADTHTLMLFTVDEVIDGLVAAGFESVEFDPTCLQSGLFVAEKPA